MEELIIGGTSVAVIIMMAIQLLKGYGMDSKYAPLVAISLGVAASILVGLDTIESNVTYWVGIVVRGAMYGLGSIGLHAASNSLQKVSDEHKLQKTAVEDQTQTEITTTATPEKVVTEVEVAPATPVEGTPPGGTQDGH